MKTDDKLISEQYHTVTENSRQNPVVDGAGNKRWYNEQGQAHREDGPAFEGADGDKVWYANDNRHREDGPAFEGHDGIKAWYINNKLHREDGPAVEYSDGDKEWYVDGDLYHTIPEWVKALFIYKGHTPEKLGQERFDDLVRAFAQRMEDKYES